jgi:hypothetical protein
MPRARFWLFSKFSSAPVIIEIARAAQFESNRDDTQKRLMVVPDCHVTRLVADGSGPIRRIVAVETSRGAIPVPEETVVVLALGTIESARLAKLSLPAARRRPDWRESDGSSAVQYDDTDTTDKSSI